MEKYETKAEKKCETGGIFKSYRNVIDEMNDDESDEWRESAANNSETSNIDEIHVMEIRLNIKRISLYFYSL